MQDTNFAPCTNLAQISHNYLSCEPIYPSGTYSSNTSAHVGSAPRRLSCGPFVSIFLGRSRRQLLIPRGACRPQVRPSAAPPPLIDEADDRRSDLVADDDRLVNVRHLLIARLRAGRSGEVGWARGHPPCVIGADWCSAKRKCISLIIMQ